MVLVNNLVSLVFVQNSKIYQTHIHNRSIVEAEKASDDEQSVLDERERVVGVAAQLEPIEW